MRHGLRFSVALSEFATAAALITIAACSVSYFYVRHSTDQHANAACVVKETVIENHYITVPAPIVRVRVVVPKPEPQPKTDMFIEPEKQKVWDNDNLPSASEPPTFDPDKQPIITTALRQPRRP